VSDTSSRNDARHSSPGLKLITVIVLTILMIVPLFAINLALSGREQRAAEATGDVASGWGGTQTVAGPVLFVPYDIERQSVVDGKTVVSHEHQQATLLPSILSVAAKADTATRWRGIFEVPVYNSSLAMKADFGPSALTGVFPDGAQLHWNEAYAGVLISDARGLANNVSLRINDRTAMFQPGIWTSGRLVPGIHAPLGLSTPPTNLHLEATIGLRGSRELSLAPLGQQTTVHMQSPWRDPSFFGNFLPVDRKIGSTGFDAQWNVPYLARGYGQSFATATDAIPLLTSSLLGVKFYQPVGFYQLVERSLKYAILFVGLSLLVFFVTELVVARRLHVMQYTLIAAAQVLFYLLLLSFAEHIGFGWSYLAAASATVLLTAAYAVSAFASRVRAAVLAVLLGTLYALLYVILNQEDYALLIGAGLLFAALAATMYATRRMDWYRMIPAAHT
jgi:inner membrane protein